MKDTDEILELRKTLRRKERDFGKAVLRFRKKERCTTRMLGEMTGYSAQYVSMIERGTCGISDEFLRRFGAIKSKL